MPIKLAPIIQILLCDRYNRYCMSDDSDEHSEEGVEKSHFQFPISIKSGRKFADVEKLQKLLYEEAEQRKMPHCRYLYWVTYTPSKKKWTTGRLHCKIKSCSAEINFVKKDEVLSTANINSTHNHQLQQEYSKQPNPVRCEEFESSSDSIGPVEIMTESTKKVLIKTEKKEPPK